MAVARLSRSETAPRQAQEFLADHGIALEIYPAIVAGRVRYIKQNYRLLSQFVGTGEIRRLFHTAT